jgi:hypothetical protein
MYFGRRRRMNFECQLSKVIVYHYTIESCQYREKRKKEEVPQGHSNKIKI